jgi:hypothetical protein
MCVSAKLPTRAHNDGGDTKVNMRLNHWAKSRNAHLPDAILNSLLTGDIRGYLMIIIN